MSIKTIMIAFVAAIIVAVIALVCILGPIARRLGGNYLQAMPDSKEKIEVTNAIRQTLVQAAGGLLLAGTLAASAIAAIQAYVSLQSQNDAQIADRYAKAVDQLGNGSAAVRAAAIYALEGISASPKSDRDTIIQAISTFARSNSRRPPNEIQREEVDRPGADTEAAIVVLGRRNQNGEVHRLRLDRIYLPNENMRALKLPGTLFHRANLAGLDAGGADTDLRNVDLSEALLTCADLSWAKVSSYMPQGRDVSKRTNLQFADLTGADLEHAELQGALMKGAKLEYAHLEGADLSYAQGLSASQLVHAFIDDKTKLPKEIRLGKRYNGKSYKCWNHVP